ncbi:MAG: methionyl-tRNA formyltransferase [Verrucomicrobia bacterium]|nr:methionyl-tRNA formyltransferase [Verrucomicrobiota bacterium]
MRIVFFGTPPFAAQILNYLIEAGHAVVGIVTRPDKPRGRSLQLIPSAVKALVQEKWPAVPLFQPVKASTEPFVEEVKQLKPDVFVVVAYGEIIKENLLKVPKKMCINIHASLLPKYRGAAPIQRAIMAGEKETGITIIEMALQMDAGAMLGMERVEIGEGTTFGELQAKLCEMSCPLVELVLKQIEQGTIQKIEQNPMDVTFAPKISFEDRIIHWDKSAEEIHNQIRGLSPEPGALCAVQVKGQKKSLTIRRAKKILNLSGKSGQCLSYKKNEWIVACGSGAISLLEVQLEGKKSMSIDEFLRGYPTEILVIA